MYCLCIGIQKAWNLILLILLLEVLEKPFNKNKQVTPTPNMKCHQTEQSTNGRSAAGYTYPNGRLLPSCFGFVKFLQDFRSPKQALINAFNMSANYVCDCKGTIKFADVQEKSHFGAIFLV